LQNPRFLELSEVLFIHEPQIDQFGGTRGIRDLGLLESAVAQPKMMFGKQLLHPEIYKQASAYLYHIARNHPFIDGNKRTAFAAMDTFLRLNNYRLKLTNDEQYQLVLKVAQGKLEKQELAQCFEQVLEKNQ
jgi:death on curing protein